MLYTSISAVMRCRVHNEFLGSVMSPQLRAILTSFSRVQESLYVCSSYFQANVIMGTSSAYRKWSSNEQDSSNCGYALDDFHIKLSAKWLGN